eukprot:4660705-Amphidinium_carterae.2
MSSDMRSEGSINQDVHKGLTTGVHCVLICEKVMYSACHLTMTSSSCGASACVCASLQKQTRVPRVSAVSNTLDEQRCTASLWWCTKRCLEQADHDYSPVTCMHYYYNGENGILAVGVREPC